MTKETPVTENHSLMDTREIVPLVVADLDERVKKGVQTYGSPLAVSSKNDALQFAYEEALDLAIYLKQELLRRG